MVLLSLSVAMPGSIKAVRLFPVDNSLRDIKQRQVGMIQIKTIHRGPTESGVLGSSTRNFQMQPGGNDNLCIDATSKEKVSYL